MCSLQTLTGTTGMDRVEDKMWAMAVDKEEELALVVFGRLAGSGCEPPNGTATILF